MSYPFGLYAYITSGSSGGSGVATFGAVGSSPSANGATVSGTVATLQPADGTHPGLVTALAQTIAGSKTFTAEVVIGTDAASNTTLPATNDIRGATLLSGGTADQAGVNLTLSTGSSKGAGTLPTIVFQAAGRGSTGTALNAPSTVLTLGGYNATYSLGNTPLIQPSGDFFSAADQNWILHNNSVTAFRFWNSAGVQYTFATDGTGFSTTQAFTAKANISFPFAGTLSPSGTTQTVDWSAGATQKVDAASTSGTLVLTFSNPLDGGRYFLKTLGLTARVWTFPSSVKWAGGVAPTVTATTGAKDMFQFIYDAGDSTYIGSIVAQNVS